MESRFSKYKTENQNLASHIANINSFINFLFDEGNKLIEKEIIALKEKIEIGNAPAIFNRKVEKLIELGECIERVHAIYHFNKDDKEAA